MSDEVGPYGYLDNATDRGVTANALVGERAGSVTAHQAEGFGPAQFSTAPYQPSKVTVSEQMLANCRFKNCRQPADDTGYCERHTGLGGESSTSKT